MKKTPLYVITLLALCLPTLLHAQIEEFEEILFGDDEQKSEIIYAPEALYISEVDSLLQLFQVQNYLTIDDACEPSEESPYYTDEQLADRLSRMPTRIDMPYNPIVRKFIDRYVNRMRKTVSLMLGSSNFYMPIFEQALESYNVPIELKYLPVIESALNPKAVSRVGATGLWQFMLATGKQYGLRVNSLVDDRRDPIRSSYAAARYLRDLFRIFGDWTLAIAAYNCGPENVNKAIRRSGGSRDYWTIYQYLPAETRGYVPAFIAANYVMTYYCEHNICPMLTTLPEHTDTVVVTRNVSFNTISKFCDIDINQLRELNPQYRRDLVNGLSEPSTIRMPMASINKFVDQEDSIMNYDALHTSSSHTYTAVEDTQPKSTRRSWSRRSSNTSASNNTTSYGSTSNSYYRGSRYGRGRGTQQADNSSNNSRYGKSNNKYASATSKSSKYTSSSSRGRKRRG